MRRVTVLTPATEEPLTLDEVKLHLRVGHNLDDLLIAALISASRRYAEQWLGRVFCTQTLELGQQDWPGVSSGGYYNRLIRESGVPWGGNWLPGAAYDPIDLPRPPLQSVVSVQYLDQAGAWQTLSPSAYQIFKGEPAKLAPAINTVWPFVNPQAIESVRIQLIAGYGAAAAVPATIKVALKLWIAYLYENRGEDSAEPPAAVQSLLSAEDFGRYG